MLVDLFKIKKMHGWKMYNRTPIATSTRYCNIDR